MSILNLIRPDLAAFKTYKINNENLDFKLDANELPWVPQLSEPVGSIELNRYPTNALKEQLQSELASHYNIKPEEILLTRGSDEAIDLLMRLFLRAGTDSMMHCPPTFAMYAFYANLQQAAIINCPLTKNDNGFSLNYKAISNLWQQNCKLIMLCRPNNPTGDLIDLATIEDLCEHFCNRAIIVVDEAYIEFASTLSATTLINKFDNIIVLRTLSKAHGLAALRLGSIIAQPSIIKALQKIVAPFTLSSIVLELGIQALKNKEWFVNCRLSILQLRTKLQCELQKSPWIQRVYPSAANFLLVKTTYATYLNNFFLQHGIAVRSFKDCKILQNHLRITIGDENANTRLLGALNLFNGEESCKTSFL